MSNRKFEAQKLSEVLNEISNQKPIAKGLKELKINELWKNRGTTIDPFWDISLDLPNVLVKDQMIFS